MVEYCLLKLGVYWSNDAKFCCYLCTVIAIFSFVVCKLENLRSSPYSVIYFIYLFIYLFPWINLVDRLVLEVLELLV
jgi:hypothetical protein